MSWYVLKWDAIPLHPSKTIHPWTKINMERNNGGFEDDFPLQMGDFLVPAVNFQGCTMEDKTWTLRRCISILPCVLEDSGALYLPYSVYFCTFPGAQGKPSPRHDGKSLEKMGWKVITGVSSVYLYQPLSRAKCLITLFDSPTEKVIQMIPGH